MNIPVSRRCLEVSPFLAMEVMERAKAMEAAGRDIIYLCLGEPDFPTPAPVLESAVSAMREGATSYTHSLGLFELREAIATHYRQRYRVEVDPGRILVSAGTSPLMLMLFSALLEAGDEVVLPDPGYSCYPNFIRFAGGCPVWLRTRAEDGFQPRIEDVQGLLSERTRGVLINSPSNPVGTILSGEQLERLAALPVPMVSDEIYHGLTYEGEERSILEFTDDAFVFGGFSKTYAMTGWRLGYLIVPDAFVRPLQSLHQNFMICANHFVQRAGIAALVECREEVEHMRQTYDARRRYLLRRLNGMGLKVVGHPVGAFYALADARHLDGDSKRLALEILEATGVALTPGVDFGAGAEGYLRFTYANSLPNLKKALDRLEVYLRQRAG